MSLEDTIKGLTDAVNALNATLQNARVAVPEPDAEVPSTPKGKAPKAAKAEAPITTGASTASSDSSAASEIGPTTATTGSPETTSTQATTVGISYDMVAKAITDTWTKDRAKVLAALAKFGAAKGPQLKPADYSAFLAELA